MLQPNAAPRTPRPWPPAPSFPGRPPLAVQLSGFRAVTPAAVSGSNQEPQDCPVSPARAAPRTHDTGVTQEGPRVDSRGEMGIPGPKFTSGLCGQKPSREQLPTCRHAASEGAQARCAQQRCPLGWSGGLQRATVPCLTSLPLPTLWRAPLQCPRPTCAATAVYPCRALIYYVLVHLNCTWSPCPSVLNAGIETCLSWAPLPRRAGNTRGPSGLQKAPASDQVW